jgi:hypothetical protein
MPQSKTAGSPRKASRPLSIEPSTTTIDGKSKPSGARAQHRLIEIGRAAECLGIRAGDGVIDLRIFSDGGGPARVRMPSARGFTIPVAALPRLIRELQGLVDG